MTIKVVIPRSGMGIDEGTVIRWLKLEGDAVAKGEVIVEIETAKATQEVEALVDGILVKVLIPVGETVPVNTPIAEIEPSHG